LEIALVEHHQDERPTRIAAKAGAKAEWLVLKREKK